MTRIWVPDKMQLKGRRFLMENLNSGLFLYPGAGKTSIILSAFMHLRRKGVLKRLLVVAPIRPAYMVWPEEPTLWEQFKDLKVVVLHGKKKDELVNEDADIHVVNYDGLPWLIRTERFRKQRGYWSMVVYDESGGIKHISTNRHRAAKVIQKKIKYCWILNGSPLPRSYMDLFGQFKIMDGGKTFGTTKGKFESSYFRRSGWGGHTWAVTKMGKEKIKKKIEGAVFSLPRKEGTPKPIYRNIVVEFTPELMREYKHFLKECIMKTPEGRVTAVNAGSLTMKAMQFTGGNIYLDGEDRTPYHIHSLKEEALLELLEELSGNPALIGYQFKHELARLKTTLKKFENPVPHLQDPSDTELIHRWNRGELSVMLGYPRTMGHGLNLQKFPEGHGAIIFYSVGHNFEYYDQMICRIARRGFTRPVIVYHLVVKGTIDEAVLKDLRKKEDSQNDFMDHVIDYWRQFDDED